MTHEQPIRDDVAAGIVVFRPDAARLLALVRAAAREAAPVYVFLNAPVEADLEARVSEAGAALIASPYNLGVAEAFNICVLAALLAGKRRIFLLDQDSDVPRGLIGALSEAMDELAASDHAPAVIGPAIVAPEGEEADYKPPRYFTRRGFDRVGASAPVQYVISSGSLIDLEAFRRVGAFRSDFFIDAIDTEWCFRAWAKGASCWVLQSASMAHRIGAGVVRKRWLGPDVPRQAPFRLYAYVRNQAHCLTLAHLPAPWKLRLAAHMLRVIVVSWADAGLAPRVIFNFWRAWRRGWSGELGPPPGAEGVAELPRRANF